MDDRQSTLQANIDKERTLQKLCKVFVEYVRKPLFEDIFEPRPSLDRTPGRQLDSRTDGSIFDLRLLRNMMRALTKPV